MRDGCKSATTTDSIASSRARRSHRHAQDPAPHQQGQAVGLGSRQGRSKPEDVIVKRSPNSHRLRVQELPFAARLRREEPFRSADAAEWRAAADRIAGPKGWYATAGMRGDWDCTLIRFASQAEADEMQEWIAASGIETRPAPPRYDGPMLTVAGVKPS